MHRVKQLSNVCRARFFGAKPSVFVIGKIPVLRVRWAVSECEYAETVPFETEEKRVVILPFDAAGAVTRSRLISAVRVAEVLRDELASYTCIDERLAWMLQDSRVEEAFKGYSELRNLLEHGAAEEAYVVALSVLLGQFDRLFKNFDQLEDRAGALKRLLDVLVSTERFYSPIGGLLGYYLQVLYLLSESKEEKRPTYASPPIYDMRQKTGEVWKYSYEGVKRLKEVAAIFTVGGAGDRLKFTDPQTGLALPVASLVFGGKPLLEWLFRDVEALEYLHYRAFREQVSLPVLLMASHEKKNVQEVERLGSFYNWFGKAPDHISMIVQSLVPAVTLDGQWVVVGPAQLMAKPGGHGVIWKLALDAKAFEWLEKVHVSSLFVRQINNPLAGLDHTVISLVGMGITEDKSFGFAACPPRPGFAEGMNVLSVNEHNEAGITNIEYTKFEAERATNPQLFEGGCPANTNILFAKLRSVAEALQRTPIPGMMVNAKVEAEVMEGEKTVRRPVARLESMMQAIADSMMVPWRGEQKNLSTFLALYDREKAISVTKKALAPGQNVYETPECCLYDWYRAGRRLLSEVCFCTLPEELSLEQFIEQGPNLSFFFHPALGPFWEVIGQKVSSGRLFSGAELELEIAELYLRNFSIRGSFRLLCDVVSGPVDRQGVRHLGPEVGRARLENISIENDGLESGPISAFVTRTVPRKSSCTIRLMGSSELVAKDVIIRGDFSLIIPDGMRVTLRQADDGGVEITKEPLPEPHPLYTVEWKSGSAPRFSPTF
jgi:hypothetical protein